MFFLIHFKKINCEKKEEKKKIKCEFYFLEFKCEVSY